MRKKMEVLRGVPASRGITAGRVYISNYFKAIEDTPGSFVLVTSAFNPDFVIVLHKVKAIITDFGGTTCHAAIIAREFEIPCVVGTRNATKKLKSGDDVLVDGNRGVVFRLL